MLTGEGAGTLFKIDEKSGDIHATKRLDREEKAYYILHAKAVNRFTNEALEGQSEFIIKIHDINDNEPRFTKDLYVARVPEMSDIGESFILLLFATVNHVTPTGRSVAHVTRLKATSAALFSARIVIYKYTS